MPLFGRGVPLLPRTVDHHASLNLDSTLHLFLTSFARKQKHEPVVAEQSPESNLHTYVTRGTDFCPYLVQNSYSCPCPRPCL